MTDDRNPGRKYNFLATLVPGMATIPASFRDLFEKPTIAHVTTLLPHGQPHTVPVWVDYDAETGRLLVNTERETQKARNVARDPRVALSMVDPEEPARFLAVTGDVEGVTADGARQHIDTLARRYTGEPYSEPIESERILLSIRATAVFSGP
jgi:PPOX class probable F420-dependent enzyme